MIRLKEKKYLFIATLFHIGLLAILGNILIVKPQVRELLFKSKIITSREVKLKGAKPMAAKEEAKEFIVPLKKEVPKIEKEIVIEKEREIPTFPRPLEIEPAEIELAKRKEIDVESVMGPRRAVKPGMLSFSEKAEVQGAGKEIRGKLILPMCVYSDWNNDPSTIPNLINEVGRRTGIKISLEKKHLNFRQKEEFFKYPIVYMNGHEGFTFKDEEVENLREYLTKGGFLFAINDMGIGGEFEKSLKREMKKIFPDSSFEKVSMSHPIHHSFYDFSGRLPHALYKNGPPEPYGIFYKDKLVVYYLATGDVCDAWAEAEPPRFPGCYYVPSATHKFQKLSQIGWAETGTEGAGEEGIENAFRIGVNVIVYVLSNMP